MTVPAGSSSAPMDPIEPSASGATTTNVGLPASQPPASELVAIAPSAPPAPPPVGHYPSSFNILGAGPPSFTTHGARISSLTRTTMTQPLITEEALQLFSTPIPRSDPTTQTMEAFRQATLAVQLQFQKNTMVVAAQQARWQETMNNERRRRALRQPWATTSALTVTVGIGFDEPVGTTLLQTLVRGFQATAVLDDRLHNKPGDSKIISSLRRMLRDTVELQENISESKQRLATTDNVLSVVGHPPQDNCQG